MAVTLGDVIVNLVVNDKNVDSRLKNIETRATQAGNTVKSGLGGAFSVALGTLAAQALSSISQALIEFASSSEEAFRKQGVYKNALTDLLGGTEAYNKAISNATIVTQGMVSETSLAAGILQLMKSRLAENADEASKLALTGTVLSSVYSAQGATFEKYLRLLSGGSPMLYDNFNITAQMVNAERQRLETVEGLSQAESKQAAIKSLLNQEAQRLLGTLSEEEKQARRNQAAYDDLQAELGELLAPAYREGREAQTEFFTSLKEALEGVNDAIDFFSKLGVSADEVSEVFSEMFAIVNPIAGLYETASNNAQMLEENLTSLAHWIIENTIGWDELATRYQAGAEAQLQSIELTSQQQMAMQQFNLTREEAIALTDDQIAVMTKEAEEQQKILNELSIAQAGYYLELQDLQAQQQQANLDHILAMDTIENESRVSKLDREKELNDGLSALNQERNQAEIDLMQQRSSMTESEYQARLNSIQVNYGQEKEALVAHNEQMAAEEAAARAKKEADQQFQHQKEQLEFQKHLEDLKLKAVLGMLETTGQLEELTGGVTNKASDAFDLIKAGIIPVNAQLSQAISEGATKLTASTNDAKVVATGNFNAIRDALNNNIKPPLDNVTMAANNAGQAIKNIKAPDPGLMAAIQNVANKALAASQNKPPSFQAGGIVPGAPNQAVPITAHGGEVVAPFDKLAEAIANAIKNVNNKTIQINYNGMQPTSGIMDLRTAGAIS